MKQLILSSLLLFSFLRPFHDYFPAKEQYRSDPGPAAPCFNLWATGTTANSDEIISIKLTNDATGQSQTYSILGQGGYVTGGAGTWCGTFDIAVTVSVGGINSAVGIRNKNTGVVYYCQSICCGDGQIITINNIPLSTPYGTSWEVFLYNGSC